MARCTVAFIDTSGIVHSVNVQADSLFEAVAAAIAELRAEGHSEEPGP